MTQIQLNPIGLIHSPFTSPAETPIQASRSQAQGRVIIFPEFSAGLQGIEGFSHLFLVYFFHRAERVDLLVEPFLDDRPHGVFCTRHPFRPNHLGLSVVRLVARCQNELTIQGVDVLDGTPLLDLKPYVPDFDHREATRSGWYDHRARP